MRQLVLRYKEPEFNVHDWELGNEPDVAPELILDPASPFGCWGDLDDPYYGGRHYGEMLKAVAPAIRSVDSKARIWNGGLLLDRPNTTSNPTCSQPGYCRPELFLEGIFLSGAASSFDILTYHAYPYFNEAYPGLDQDNGIPSDAWFTWGGRFVGKANFIRQTMQTYGVNLPLVINETSIICKYGCLNHKEIFFQRQADFLTRSYVRALANNITGLIWYTLEGPGWYDSGLLSYGDSKACIPRLREPYGAPALLPLSRLGKLRRRDRGICLRYPPQTGAGDLDTNRPGIIRAGARREIPGGLHARRRSADANRGWTGLPVYRRLQPHFRRFQPMIQSCAG